VALVDRNSRQHPWTLGDSASLAEEQAALRRVATLVGRRSPPDEVFAAAVEEVAGVLGAPFAHLGRFERDDTITFVATWGGKRALPVGTRLALGGTNVCTAVARTGLPERVDYAVASGPIADAASERGVRFSVGTPIVVEGRIWGVTVIGSSDDEFPPGTEARLSGFTELLATAIANTESRGELAKLANEQAALRRVATLVARGTSQEQVFAAVTEEVGRLLPVEFAIMNRYEPDESMIVLAAAGDPVADLSVGSLTSLGGRNVSTLVHETGRSARIDDYSDHSSGPIGVAGREHAVRSTVGTPIIVERRLWGVMIVGSTFEQSLPTDAEIRLASFTELLATAVANAESRAELAQAADEQAALSRVATLVAHGAASEELFAAVTREVGLLLGASLAGMGRYEGNEAVTVLTAWAAEGEEHPLVAGPWPLDGGDVASTVFRTGKSVRIGDYQGVAGTTAAFVRDQLGISSSVASPIVVEGRLWGVLYLHARQTKAPFTRATESRLTEFTELVAAAIANAQSRADLARLAQEQAALGRVATLVASGVPPEQVFAAVTGEVGRLLIVDYAGLGRYESDGTLTFVASWGRAVEFVPVGSRWSVGGGRDISTLIFETGRPARIDSYVEASGRLSVAASDRGVRSSVGTPIIVEGRLWGVMGAASSGERPLPADTELRLASFTELVAMAIGNAESRSELEASRVRIVAAGDEMRRRIERDLHDGAQQQLVSLMLELRKAEAMQPQVARDLKAQLVRTGEALADVLDGLQEISRGIHPAILSKGGLGPAFKALSRRSAVPVELEVRAERRLPGYIEVAAYYVASEALANAAKHAQASVVMIELDAQDAILRLAIRDDGVGGADPSRGSGLVGLADRIEALGGRFEMTSPLGKGTAMFIAVPIETQA
jgi:GAF domain-containing protein